jgi:hypothetical protein
MGKKYFDLSGLNLDSNNSNNSLAADFKLLAHHKVILNFQKK